jgi:hypothetical protein
VTAIPKWAPATTYAPGALVVPRSSAPPAFTGLDNPKLTDTTGWDLDSPLAILADGQGYAGEGRIACQGTSNGANGLNQAHIPINPGQKVGVSAMCAHGTSDKHSSDGNVKIVWFNSSNVQVGSPAVSGGLPSLSNAGWQQLSVSGTAPAGATYCRVGFGVYRHGSDTIQISHFTLNYTPQAPLRATMYEATQAKPGKSAGTEPIWPPLGESVQDNEVTWNGVNIDRIVWQASPLLESGATEPDWPTAPGGAVHDGTIDWVAVVPYITDPNCPNTPIVAIMASKVFAADKDIVRFCATANALDWTSQQDAGYLPTGLQQSNSNDMAVLAPYRGNLTAFNASCFQNWQVDPDPAAMALLDQMEGIGSIWRLAAQPVGNELFYLSQLGVRSVSIAAGSDNLQNGDIGMPVDSLVQAAVNALASGSVPRAMYYPGAGQYWLAVAPADLSIFGHLADNFVGVSGTYQYLLAGGIKPRSVEVTSGALPDGATIDSDGLVTYSYTTAGTFSWELTLTDGAELTATLDDSNTIYENVQGAQLSDWKYLQVDDSDDTDRSAPGFDDSSWSTGTAPFGSWSDGTLTLPAAAAYNAAFNETFATAWTTWTRLWLRRTLNLTAVPANGIKITYYMDDHFTLYVNGVDVFDSVDNPDGGAGSTFVVPSPNLVAGDNCIAILCHDEEPPGEGTSVTYFDMFVEPAPP